MPKAVEHTAEAFVTAYAEQDARDGGDSSYADAGGRAAQLAAGDLVGVLSQQRPGQEVVWAALRAEQAHRTVEIISVVVPDGAPAVTNSSALVRVGYVLTTSPATGEARLSNEQIVLQLEHTAEGWRVIALPWV
ncbi:hypothetical protein ACWGIB_10640 [Streptomyces xiamenensis]